MWLSVARSLVVATCFAACLATWPLGSPPGQGDGSPVVGTGSTPSGDGFLVEDADEREGEEEREDQRASPATFETAVLNDQVRPRFVAGDPGFVFPPPRPAHSLGPIRAPPRNA